MEDILIFFISSLRVRLGGKLLAAGSKNTVRNGYSCHSHITRQYDQVNSTRVTLDSLGREKALYAGICRVSRDSISFCSRSLASRILAIISVYSDSQPGIVLT